MTFRDICYPGGGVDTVSVPAAIDKKKKNPWVQHITCKMILKEGRGR